MITNYNIKLYSNIQEKKKRLSYKKKELYILALKKILRNIKLNNSEKLKINILINKKIKLKSFTKIQDKCIFTGRTRWLIKDFKMARHQFKNFTLKGLIPNIARYSW